ncbi:MAG: DNA polymerase III subunit beta [Patescibacteria group bacterium]
MKFTVLSQVLKDKISTAERFTGKNITLPVLSNILLSTSNKELIITSTNLEIACTLYISGKIIKEGSCAVPARTFSSFIQTFKNDEKVTIEDRNGTLFIETESTKTKILTSPIKDFPLIPKIKKERNIRIKKDDLQKSISEVLPAVSLSQLKPEINGIYISWDKKEKILTLAATDTFRLAEKKIFLESEDSADFSFILPFRSAQELSHFESDADVADIIYGESQVRIAFLNDEMVTNTVNGLFPQYSGIIPKSFETRVEIKREYLIGAIKSTSFFTSKLQDVSFQVRAGELEVHAENSEVGETSSVVAATVKGNPMKIAFNFKYILDGLSALSGDSISILMNSESSPVLLKSMDQSLYTYLLMPIQAL